MCLTLMNNGLRECVVDELKAQIKTVILHESSEMLASWKHLTLACSRTKLVVNT